MIAGTLAVALYLGSLFVFTKGYAEVDRVKKCNGSEYVASQVQMYVVPFAMPEIATK